MLKVGALCEAFAMPLSTHCAPALHAHPGCALPALRHAEYFYDHVRIENMLFDGVLQRKTRNSSAFSALQVLAA